MPTSGWPTSVGLRLATTVGTPSTRPARSKSPNVLKVLALKRVVYFSRERVPRAVSQRGRRAQHATRNTHRVHAEGNLDEACELAAEHERLPRRAYVRDGMHRGAARHGRQRSQGAARARRERNTRPVWRRNEPDGVLPHMYCCWPIARDEKLNGVCTPVPLESTTAFCPLGVHGMSTLQPEHVVRAAVAWRAQ